jgi:hypothetical protein
MPKEQIYFLKIWSLKPIDDERLFLSISKNMDKYTSLIQLWKADPLKYEDKNWKKLKESEKK